MIEQFKPRRAFIQGVLAGAIGLLAVQVAWFSGAEQVSAQIYTDPNSTGLIPYGRSGVYQSGPNGITIVVPEQLGQNRNAPGTASNPNATFSGNQPVVESDIARQQAGQGAGQAAGTIPQNVTCNCQCPVCPADGQGAGSVGDPNAVTGPQNPEQSSAQATDQSTGQANSQTVTQDRSQAAGQVAPASGAQSVPPEVTYGPPTRYQDQSGAEQTYQEERAQRLESGQARPDDLNR